MSDQGSQGLLSPILRATRMRATRRWLKGRVLDIGCGGGRLAKFVDPELYLGIDRDAAVLESARLNFPRHRFDDALPANERFDTVVALAVVEHLSDPTATIREWSACLSDSGKLVLTTPHRSLRYIHELGALLGLFSKEAADEHEVLFDRDALYELARRADLVPSTYQRFLLGANQLFVMKLPVDGQS